MPHRNRSRAGPEKLPKRQLGNRRNWPATRKVPTPASRLWPSKMRSDCCWRSIPLGLHQQLNGIRRGAQVSSRPYCNRPVIVEQNHFANSKQGRRGRAARADASIARSRGLSVRQSIERQDGRAVPIPSTSSQDARPVWRAGRQNHRIIGKTV